MENKDKKAILVVSFGTSYQKTRERTLDVIERDLREAFAGYEFKRAYTSPTIVRILRERDKIQIDGVEEAFERLVKDGFGTVLVQTTHVIHGFEYDRMKFLQNTSIFLIIWRWESLFLHPGRTIRRWCGSWDRRRRPSAVPARI